MKYCNNCFKPKKECNCGNNQFVEIDYLMYPSVYELNRKGYKTVVCCSGHENYMSSFYLILRKKEYNIICETNYFEFEKTKYRGVVKIKEGEIRPTKKYREEIKSIRTIKDRKKFLIKVNRLLYQWAKELKEYDVNQEMENKEFDDKYFDQYLELNESSVGIIAINPNIELLKVYKKFFEFGEEVNNIALTSNSIYEIEFKNYHNDSIPKLLIENGEAIVSYPNCKLSSEVNNLFGSQWITLCFDKNIKLHNYLKVYKDINSMYYKNNSVISALSMLFNKMRNQDNCKICCFTNGQITIIFSTDVPFSYYIENDMLVITNDIENEVSENQFEIVNPQNEYYVFAGNILLAKGEIRNERI